MQITLKSKDGINAVFNGKKLGSISYPTMWNWITCKLGMNNRGWTYIDLYQTESGQHIIYKRYGRELPRYGKEANGTWRKASKLDAWWLKLDLG